MEETKLKLSQKLSKRTERRNTPTDTSLVCSNCDLALNKDESLSVQGLKTFDNNLEVNQRLQHTGGLKDKVYVRSIEGKVLMPCSKTKARHLLEKGKAKVLGVYPFRIQLTFKCDNKVQDVTLGIDPGYEHVGYSAVTDKDELLSGELKIENGMSNRLIEKRMYRRGRRNKLWYRQPRFNNRKKELGVCPPSVERRINTHIELVKRICKLIPVSKVNIEIANFDIQKINNPDIKSDGYQQGSLYGYENTKTFIIARENGRCQLCGESWDENGWHLHHVIPRSKGGTDKPNNQALLHKKCHKKLHKQELYKMLKTEKQYKAETFMSTAKERITEGIKEIISSVEITYGYETKVKRIEQGLNKTHNNDAFIIARGTTQKRSDVFVLSQKKRNSRVLQTNRNGYKPAIRKRRYKIQPKDLFWVDKIKYICKGMFSYGRYILYGDAKKKEYFKVEEVGKYFNTNTWQFTRYLKEAVFLPQGG